MKREFDSVAIAAVYLGEDLFPADRKDLSSDYHQLQSYIIEDEALFGVTDISGTYNNNYIKGTLKYALMRNFNGISDFSCAVGLYLDEIEALEVPLENRNDHICALARQYLAPAEIDIEPAP